MNLSLRDAEKTDAPLLLKAEKTITQTPGQLISKPHELKLENFELKIQSLNLEGRGKYIVAEKNGVIVGHAYLDPMPFESIRHVFHLMIAVHTRYQGQGIGVEILSFLIDWARSQAKVEKIELQVRSVNSRAIALYTKLGFKEEGRWSKRVKLSDDQYCDEVLMGLWVK